MSEATAIHPELAKSAAAVALAPEGMEMLEAFRHEAKRVGYLVTCEPPEIEERQAVDHFWSVYENSGLLAYYGEAQFDDAMRGIERRPPPLPYQNGHANGHAIALPDDVPPPSGPEDYGIEAPATAPQV